MHIPQTLAEHRADDPDPEFTAWLAELPAVVDDLSERWSLRVGEPFEPGGYCGWVAPARDADGRDLVLKAGWRHAEAEHEADALRLWDGDGAVRLHAAEVSGRTSALLLERCRPGGQLADLAPPLEQDVVLAGVLRRLWREPPAGHPFRPLHTMCDDWADEFADDPGEIDPGLARAGIGLLRSLPRDPVDQVVLCTDLHAENVLAAEREPWLVIDPKPYLGDPCYDVTQHLFNDDNRLRADAGGWADRMAALAEVDRERVRLWLFARCVQDSPGEPWLVDLATRLAP